MNFAPECDDYCVRSDDLQLLDLDSSASDLIKPQAPRPGTPVLLTMATPLSPGPDGVPTVSDRRQEPFRPNDTVIMGSLSSEEDTTMLLFEEYIPMKGVMYDNFSARLETGDRLLYFMDGDQDLRHSFVEFSDEGRMVRIQFAQIAEMEYDPLESNFALVLSFTEVPRDLVAFVPQFLPLKHKLSIFLDVDSIEYANFIDRMNQFAKRKHMLWHRTNHRPPVESSAATFFANQPPLVSPQKTAARSTRNRTTNHALAAAVVEDEDGVQETEKDIEQYMAVAKHAKRRKVGPRSGAGTSGSLVILDVDSNSHEAAPHPTAVEVTSSPVRSPSVAPATNFLRQDDCVTLGVYERITLTAGDMRRCSVGEFLNDNLIEMYVAYVRRHLLLRGDTKLSETVHFFSTQFFSARLEMMSAFVRRVNFWDQKLLLVPVHHATGLHWSLAVVLRPDLMEQGNTQILYFDSMPRTRNSQPVRKLRQFLGQQARNPAERDQARTVRGRYVSVPSQSNGSDCGVFVLCFIERIVSELIDCGDADTFCAKISSDLEREAWFGYGYVGQMRQRLKQMCLELSVSAGIRDQGLLWNTLLAKIPPDVQLTGFSDRDSKTVVE